ncbi:MAG: SagB/ThcOx family dehydrogenase [Theionarchaea archaeon]|nr:SagB/ThcOx family dehydrogenase [Theionarchaea archaeon]MBU6999282.1 SagB/ThcOx family dehydrogenase [Theionarchaea archaeon]MBU7019593.1 SagB/ThcOx family dehydrogenase [Theionarchaea archaeon]MBU7033772.1 SagB/ThcOx family dehydrogenase [Theionarchaea archaeon]MBU7039418.1 SagB/ThcOx family dehydrogenase [Theionarchaea archaeon]
MDCRHTQHMIIWKMLPLLIVVLSLSSCMSQSDPVTVVEEKSEISLPAPHFKGDVSVEEAIKNRRSMRDFRDTSLSLEHVSQLLWAGQGITEGFKRAAPSAGATYPLTLFVVVGGSGVEELNAGIYQYIPESHELLLVREGDYRERLAAACLSQLFIREAPISIVVVALYEKTTARYGERGIRYVHMEAGHAGENIYLQAEGLNLGTVVVGAFVDAEVQSVLGLPEELIPLYVMPVGFPR